MYLSMNLRPPGAEAKRKARCILATAGPVDLIKDGQLVPSAGASYES